MVRAIGRSSDDEMPLISYLLSVHLDLRKEVAEQPQDQAAKQRRSFNTFRPILPRTMSSLVLSSDLPSPTSPQPTRLDAPELPSRERSPSPLDVGPGRDNGVTGDSDPVEVYFNKVSAWSAI